MQKLRGYLALGIFIMGIVSLLCLLLPLIEITDDALLLMVFAVPPLICGLFIALALHMLLYTLLLVLYGCRIQLVALYFLHIRRKTVGWRVQYLPAAERKVGILLAAVPWEQETGDLQQRAQIVLYYVQSVLAILFYALAVNLYGTASAIACLVLAWGYAFLSIIMPPSEIRKVFQPEKRRKMWQMQCLLAENLTDHLFTEMPEEYFAPPDKIQNQNDAALMINCSARLMMQNRYGEALDILTMLAQEHREQTKRLWWQLIPRGVLYELALDKPGYFLKEYDTLYMQKELRKHEKQPLVWRTAYAVHLLRDGTLAVFHDSDLKRMTGVTGVLEDCTAQDLAALGQVTAKLHSVFEIDVRHLINAEGANLLALARMNTIIRHCHSESSYLGLVEKC